MASLGADLQVANNELVSIIEELRERRGVLDRSIQKEEDDRLQIVAQIQELTNRLQILDHSLQAKYATRKDFDEAIQQSSSTFASILDSSRALLSSVKRDSLALVSKSADVLTLNLSSSAKPINAASSNRP